MCRFYRCTLTPLVTVLFSRASLSTLQATEHSANTTTSAAVSSHVADAADLVGAIGAVLPPPSDDGVSQAPSEELPGFSETLPLGVTFDIATVKGV